MGIAPSGNFLGKNSGSNDLIFGVSPLSVKTNASLEHLIINSSGMFNQDIRFLNFLLMLCPGCQLALNLQLKHE
jgi:hypothetical protein